MNLSEFIYFVVYILGVVILTYLSVRIPTKFFRFKTNLVDKVIASNGFVAFVAIVLFASLSTFGVRTSVSLSPSEFVSVFIAFIDYSGVFPLYKNRVENKQLIDKLDMKDQGLTIIKTDASGEQTKIEVPKE